MKTSRTNIIEWKLNKKYQQKRQKLNGKTIPMLHTFIWKQLVTKNTSATSTPIVFESAVSEYKGLNCLYLISSNIQVFTISIQMTELNCSQENVAIFWNVSISKAISKFFSMVYDLQSIFKDVLLINSLNITL